MKLRLTTMLTTLVLAPSILLAAEAWRLPIPGAGAPTPRAGVSGVLVRMGDAVYQARDFGLQRTAEGEIAIAWLQGYDAAGVSVRIERTLTGATTLGFAKVRVGADGGGYLLVGEGTGPLSLPAYPCGLSHLATCEPRQCDRCGDAPACACTDVNPGGCDQRSHDFCEGSCGQGACLPSGSLCGCLIPPAPAPSTTRTDPRSPREAPELVPGVPPE